MKCRHTWSVAILGSHVSSFLIGDQLTAEHRQYDSPAALAAIDLIKCTTVYVKIRQPFLDRQSPGAPVLHCTLMPFVKAARIFALSAYCFLKKKAHPLCGQPCNEALSSAMSMCPSADLLVLLFDNLLQYSRLMIYFKSPIHLWSESGLHSSRRPV